MPEPLDELLDRWGDAERSAAAAPPAAAAPLRRAVAGLRRRRTTTLAAGTAVLVIVQALMLWIAQPPAPTPSPGPAPAPIARSAADPVGPTRLAALLRANPDLDPDHLVLPDAPDLSWIGPATRVTMLSAR
ncbi:MAG: hypothetical protein IBJ11_11555 [Phycisphaerales bacterium]|nr:hypothetical protein [Phycisphaerales bacterium]